MTDELDPTAPGDGTGPTDQELRALLAALPDPPLPDDVAARIDAALAAAVPPAQQDATVRTLPTAGGAAAGGRSWRRTWLPRAAAAVVLVVAVAGAAVTVLDDGGPTDVTIAADDRYPSAENRLTTDLGVTTSGRAYTVDSLEEDVRTVLRPVLEDGPATLALAPEGAGEAGPAEGEVHGAGPGSHGAGPGSQSSFGFSSGPEVADDSAAGLTEHMHDEDRRAACVAELSGRDDVTPLAVDVGTFEGRPAALVLLPLTAADDGAPRVEAWVVGPTCSDADDPFPLYFRDVTLH